MSLRLQKTTGSGSIRYVNSNNLGRLQYQVADFRPWSKIRAIIRYLRQNTNSLRNPNFFTYYLDGDPYQIEDGGLDMYDRGNYTAPWLLNNTSYQSQVSIPSNIAINYASQSSTLTDTDFYYASIGYSQSVGSWPGGQQYTAYHPLTVIGSRRGAGPIGFQKAGNLGADGTGSIATGSIYTGSIVNGFTTHAFFRQTFGSAIDPTICDLYIILGHSNWSSSFGTIISSSHMNTNLNGAMFYATGSSSNLLAIASLLSRTSSIAITQSEIKSVVDNYTILIKDALNY